MSDFGFRNANFEFDDLIHPPSNSSSSQPNSLIRNSQFAIRNSQSEYIWALKDVSFEIKHGEVVGIIGRNGPRAKGKKGRDKEETWEREKVLYSFIPLSPYRYLEVSPRLPHHQASEGYVEVERWKRGAMEQQESRVKLKMGKIVIEGMNKETALYANQITLNRGTHQGSAGHAA